MNNIFYICAISANLIIDMVDIYFYHYKSEIYDFHAINPLGPHFKSEMIKIILDVAATFKNFNLKILKMADNSNSFSSICYQKNPFYNLFMALAKIATMPDTSKFCVSFLKLLVRSCFGIVIFALKIYVVSIVISYLNNCLIPEYFRNWADFLSNYISRFLELRIFESIFLIFIGCCVATLKLFPSFAVIAGELLNFMASFYLNPNHIKNVIFYNSIATTIGYILTIDYMQELRTRRPVNIIKFDTKSKKPINQKKRRYVGPLLDPLKYPDFTSAFYYVPLYDESDLLSDHRPNRRYYNYLITHEYPGFLKSLFFSFEFTKIPAYNYILDFNIKFFYYMSSSNFNRYHNTLYCKFVPIFLFLYVPYCMAFGTHKQKIKIFNHTMSSVADLFFYYFGWKLVLNLMVKKSTMRLFDMLLFPIQLYFRISPQNIRMKRGLVRNFANKFVNTDSSFSKNSEYARMFGHNE